MFIIIIVPLQVMKKNLHKKYQVVDILRISRVQNFKAVFFFLEKLFQSNWCKFYSLTQLLNY